jgi:hypothetical protein
MILLCALTLSVMLNIHQYYLRRSAAQINIAGTFQQMYVSAADVKYFVFLQDGQYVLYQNGTVLDDGVYSAHPKDSGLFELKSMKSKKSCVVWSSKSLYLVDPNGNASAFQKMSDTPIFADIDPTPYVNS